MQKQKRKRFFRNKYPIRLAAVFLFFNLFIIKSNGQDSTLLGRFILGAGVSWGFQSWYSTDVSEIGSSGNSGKYTEDVSPNSYLFYSLNASYIFSPMYQLNLKLLNEYETFGIYTSQSGYPKIDTALFFNHYSDFYEMNVALRIVMNNNPVRFTYVEMGFVPGFQKSEKMEYAYLRYDNNGHPIQQYRLSETDNVFQLKRVLFLLSFGREESLFESNFYYDVSLSFYFNLYQTKGQFIDLQNSKWSLNGGIGYRLNGKRHS